MRLKQLSCLQEKDVEESALDAKKRRRLGNIVLAASFVLGLCCPGRSTSVRWQCCWVKQLDITAERDPLHQGLIVERAKLKPRGYQLDLSSRLGKTQVVTNSTPLNQQVRLHNMTATLGCPPCAHCIYAALFLLARSCTAEKPFES